MTIERVLGRPSRHDNHPVGDVTIGVVVATMKAVADPVRLRILSLLESAANGEANVSELTDAVGLSQPTISHHMGILLSAGLVTADKRGVFMYYAIADEALGVAVKALETLVPKQRRQRRRAA